MAKELQGNPSSPLDSCFMEGLQQFVHARAEDYRYNGLNPTDLEHEFFFRVGRGLKNWRGHDMPIEHWLSVILKNAYRALVRKIIRRMEVPIDPQPAHEDRSPMNAADKKNAACWSADSVWIKDATQKAFGAASELERRVAMMRCIEGMTLEEVAQALGMTPSRVNRLFRSFAKKARNVLGESFSLKRAG
jgi:RNA polymerase sigma factor (sigma-70 family)